MASERRKTGAPGIRSWVASRQQKICFWARSPISSSAAIHPGGQGPLSHPLAPEPALPVSEPDDGFASCGRYLHLRRLGRALKVWSLDSILCSRILSAPGSPSPCRAGPAPLLGKRAPGRILLCSRFPPGPLSSQWGRPLRVAAKRLLGGRRSHRLERFGQPAVRIARGPGSLGAGIRAHCCFQRSQVERPTRLLPKKENSLKCHRRSTAFAEGAAGYGREPESRSGLCTRL